MNPGRGTAQAAGPAWRVVLALSAAVLVAHLVLLSNAAGLAPVLHPAARPDVPPLQTRLIAPAAPQPPAAPVAAAVTTSAAPGRASARMLAQSTAPEQLLSPAPMQEPAAEPARTPESPLAPAAAENTAAPPLDAASVAQSDAGTMPVASSAQAPIDGPIAVADTSAADESARTEQVARADPSATTVQAAGRTGGPAAVTEADTANTSAIHSAIHNASGLTVDRAHLPPSLVMEYEMTGMDRGLNYHASGELRWQHNDERYALSLTVRALLLGSREWRSQGQIGPQGLQPLRFSDKRRTERATHFDHEGGRLVFSGSAAPVPLVPGAQDQISLYVQMAAAIASAASPMPVGTRLQVQTATTRDALPWLLTLERHETLRFEGQALDTAYWVCLPRQRFDARVELWTSPLHHHLPARIRITQASGSFIDLQLRSLQTLAPLPA